MSTETAAQDLPAILVLINAHENIYILYINEFFILYFEILKFFF